MVSKNKHAAANLAQKQEESLAGGTLRHPSQPSQSGQPSGISSEMALEDQEAPEKTTCSVTTDESHWPKVSDIFQEHDDDLRLRFDRVKPEPKVICSCGKGSVFLSRLPWQSRCMKCQSNWLQHVIREYYHQVGLMKLPWSKSVHSDFGETQFAEPLHALRARRASKTSRCQSRSRSRTRTRNAEEKSEKKDPRHEEEDSSTDSGAETPQNQETVNERARRNAQTMNEESSNSGDESEKSQESEKPEPKKDEPKKKPVILSPAPKAQCRPPSQGYHLEIEHIYVPEMEKVMLEAPDLQDEKEALSQINEMLETLAKWQVDRAQLLKELNQDAKRVNAQYLDLIRRGHTLLDLSDHIQERNEKEAQRMVAERKEQEEAKRKEQEEAKKKEKDEAKKKEKEEAKKKEKEEAKKKENEEPKKKEREEAKKKEREEAKKKEHAEEKKKKQRQKDAQKEKAQNNRRKQDACKKIFRVMKKAGLRTEDLVH